MTTHSANGTAPPDSGLLLRVPPQDLRAEAAVLGALLHQPNEAGSIVELLDARDFYARPHRQLFEVMRVIVDSGDPTDPLLVRNECERRGILAEIGGAEFLASLVEQVESPANVERYARIVREKSIARDVIHATATIQRAAYEDEGNGDDLLVLAEQTIFALSRGSDPASKPNLRRDVDDVVLTIGAPVARAGVRTGYVGIDEILGRLEPGTLTLLGARPSMGKSSLALNIALRLAMEGVAVAFLSLEMGHAQIIRRCLSILSGVPLKRLKGGFELTEDELRRVHDARDVLVELPLIIDDQNLTTSTLRTRVRHLRSRQQADLVIVDHLGKLRPPKGERISTQIEIVTHVSGSLANTARTFGVPILALCQLSRGNARENEKAKKAEDVVQPSLTDLRDSGSLEQDADNVLFLHRDSYYTKDSTDATARVIVAKNRDGELGDVGLAWIPSCQRFESGELR